MPRTARKAIPVDVHNIGGMVEETTPSTTTDYGVIYDSVRKDYRSVKLSNWPGGGTPGGSDKQVQFNDGGVFGGDAGLVYDKATNQLTVESITGLAAPSGGSDAANKDYVDALANGLDWKASVRAATTAAGTLATDFENGDTIDGVVLATGDRILLKDQSAGAENGIYVVAASGAPTRASDANVSAEVTSGMACLVSEGTANGDKVFVLTTNDLITLGTTALVFAQLAGGSYTHPNHTGDVTSVGDGATTIAAAAVTLAKMANLAQDQFIGRVTASTGVPETATITAAARTVLDDTTVAKMVDTLGAAPSTGSGGLVRETSPTLTTPNISGQAQLQENASIGLDPSGSADGKYSGITVAGTAGYTQAFGDLVTKDKDDSRWEAVDISVAAAATGDARGILGMVVVAGTDGNSCTILLMGIIRADAKFPALTIGANVYASTAGAITVTQPSTTDYVIRIVGAALTADEIFFRPDFTWITHT